MKTLKYGFSADRRGMALLYAVMAAFVAAGLVILVLGVALASNRTADTERTRQDARFLAQGALEAAKKEVQTSIANWSPVPASGTATVDGRTAQYWVRPTGFNRTVVDTAGIQTIESGVEIRAAAQGAAASAQAFRVMNSLATPIFQFAVFYTGDLEVLPGPNMTIRGRMHTNSSMYLGSNATLTLNTNYVRAVGQIYRNRKDDPTQSPGIVNIRKWVQNPWDAVEPSQYYTMWSRSQMTAMGIPSTGGFDSNFITGWDGDLNGSYYDVGDLLPFGPGALEYWSQPSGYSGGSGATVSCGDHGVGEAVVPQIGSISMYDAVSGGNYVWDGASRSYVAAAPGTGTHNKGYYHSNAGLVIQVNQAGTSFQAFDATGANVTAAVGAAVTLSNIYDARQANGAAGTTRVVNIDVAALQATGKFPTNGLIYAAHYGAGTGTNAKGVRLTNGSVLPAKLTVVSENPVYIQGDYNVGTAASPKKGAAVIADAINLLSNAWNNSKTNTSGLPSATNTTYNVAMIAGNTNTSVGNYNGGLENLPRFHENWSGRTCTIKGSLINTWNSRFATGAWVYGGNRYTAPNRDWMYDTAFNNVLNLPPFTPVAVSARDIVTW